MPDFRVRDLSRRFRPRCRLPLRRPELPAPEAHRRLKGNPSLQGHAHATYEVRKIHKTTSLGNLPFVVARVTAAVM